MAFGTWFGFFLVANDLKVLHGKWPDTSPTAAPQPRSGRSQHTLLPAGAHGQTPPAITAATPSSEAAAPTHHLLSI